MKWLLPFSMLLLSVLWLSHVRVEREKATQFSESLLNQGRGKRLVRFQGVLRRKSTDLFDLDDPMVWDRAEKPWPLLAKVRVIGNLPRGTRLEEFRLILTGFPHFQSHLRFEEIDEGEVLTVFLFLFDG